MKRIMNGAKKWPSFSIAYILLAFLVLIILQSWIAPNVENVSYSKFKKYITEGKINSVVVSSKFLKGYEKRRGRGSKRAAISKKDLYDSES